MIVLDRSGSLLMTSVATHTVRRIDPATGASTVIAGSGAGGFSGDAGPATAAKLDTPFGLAVDSAGNLFIADAQNHRIRKVTPDGIISTVAGSGKAGFGGDGGKALSAQLNFPAALAVDSAGNLFVSDVSNSRVRKITPAGVISTIAGIGKPGFGGDGGKATAAQLSSPGPLAFDKDGNLYIVDVLNHRVRKVNPAGVISTVAGNGNSGSTGDGGPAHAAQLTIPAGLAVGPVGNLFIADSEAHRVRKITFSH
jgi:sugar lactone lactonase YvrE